MVCPYRQKQHYQSMMCSAHDEISNLLIFSILCDFIVVFISVLYYCRWQAGSWLLFLASPIKSNQKEGDPGLPRDLTGGVPSPANK
jgi:hypothetical protein